MLLYYILPASLVWMLVGLLLNAIPLSTGALILLVLYAVFYGLYETTGRARPSPPGSRWQVPSDWVRGVSKRRRRWIWGAMLGPGFATRNPYAGFGLLVLAVAGTGNVLRGLLLAATIGIAHSTGRALALMRDVKLIHSADYIGAVLKAIYWRIFDGYALLVIAGIDATVCLHRF